METRANHILIGAFALGVTLMGFLFVMWLSKVQVAAQYAYYDIKFTGSVSGLPLGGEVRFNGVRVGTVEAINFVPSEPEAVHVLAKIEKREDFSIRKDSQVSLQFLGITGLTYVQIAGGSVDSPKLPIVSRPSEDVPIIVAQPSTISQLVEAVPNLVAKAQITFDRLNAVLDEENQERITEIITNLADGSEDLGAALKNINELSGHANDFLAGDGKKAVKQLTQAARSIDEAANLSNQILEENRQAVNDFTVQGLTQLGTFVVEARQLVATLDRIAQRVETDPAGFVLGGAHGQEIEVRP